MTAIIMARTITPRYFMRIITVNLNGIRSAAGKGFYEWLSEQDADIVCLQEIKATIAQYGGRYLVRGGTVDPKEGGWSPKRVVVLEFPSMAQAQAWYASPEYAPLLAIRLRAAKAKLLIVEGYAG